MRMRISIAVVCLLVTFGALPASALPIEYTIDFTLSPNSTPIAPTSGFFYYDPAEPSGPFTDFTVSWDGNTYDLTASANSPSYSPYGAPPCTDGLSGGAATFALLTACSGVTTSNAWTAGDCCEFNSEYVQPPGQFAFAAGGDNYPTIYVDATVGDSPDNAFGTFAVTATPEPSVTVLTLIGLCLTMRKRIFTVLRQCPPNEVSK